MSDLVENPKDPFSCGTAHMLFTCRMFEATESPMLVEATTEFQDQMYNVLACDILATPSGRRL